MAREGLKGVHFRAIGMRLGVDHKALYTYVADKDDLLTGMFDATLSALELPQREDPRPPADQLVALLVSLRKAFMANVDLLHLVASKVTFSTERAAEGVWSALLAIVPDLDRAAELYTNLVQLTIGSAVETARYRVAEPVRTSALAALDPHTQARLTAYARAMTNIDRDKLFESTLRAALHAAAESSK